MGYLENFTPVNPLVIPMHVQVQLCLIFVYIVVLSFSPNKFGKKIVFRLCFLIIYYRIICIVGFQPLLVEKNFLEIVFRIPGDRNNPSNIVGFEGEINGRENIPGHNPVQNQFLWDWYGPSGRQNPHV